MLPQSADGGTGGGRADGGTGGGGGGALGGGTGGGMGGGGGIGGGIGGGAGGGTGGGGGGGSQCGVMSCSSGCCLGNNCVPVMSQGNSVCGFFGRVCAPCGMNEGCVNGQCQPFTFLDAGISPVGGACTMDSNCGNDGLSFCIPEISGGQPTGFPGGYCSRMCDNAPCPPGGTCVEAQTEGGEIVNICLGSCTSQANCRPSYQCDTNQPGGMGVCLP